MGSNENRRASKSSRNNSSGLHFTSVSQSEVPRSRKGKHNQIVADILGDVNKVSAGQAVKVPRDGIGSSVQKIRSALSRASRKQKQEIATAADNSFLYVWRKGASGSDL